MNQKKFSFLVLICGIIFLQSCGPAELNDCLQEYSQADVKGILQPIKFPISEGDRICTMYGSASISLRHLGIDDNNALKELIDQYDKAITDAGFKMVDYVNKEDSNTVFDAGKKYRYSNTRFHTGAYRRFYVKDRRMIEFNIGFTYDKSDDIAGVGFDVMPDYYSDQEIRENLKQGKNTAEQIADLVSDYKGKKNKIDLADSVAAAVVYNEAFLKLKNSNPSLPFSRSEESNDSLYLDRDWAQYAGTIFSGKKLAALVVPLRGRAAIVEHREVVENGQKYSGTFENGRESGMIYLIDLEAWKVLCSAPYSAVGTNTVVTNENSLSLNLADNIAKEVSSTVKGMNGKIKFR